MWKDRWENLPMATVDLPDDLKRVLQSHWKETSAICDSFAETLIAKLVPPIIYHYTDDHGLRGILETGRLWFTDLFNLNDPSELSHGITRALEILKSEADIGPPEAKVFHKFFHHMN